jgi:hypothetical protein
LKPGRQQKSTSSFTPEVIVTVYIHDAHFWVELFRLISRDEDIDILGKESSLVAMN